MSFNSLAFLIFLPVVIFLYYIMPNKLKVPLLLIASYIFYGYYNVLLLPLIIFTTLLTYFFALKVTKIKKKGFQKFFLGSVVFIIVGLLIVFKYLDFLYGSSLAFLNLFGLNIEFKSFDIILPMGISFYTFQVLAYIIDVYKGKVIAEKYVLNYALFVVFFPQLVAGPIERSSDLIPQLTNPLKLEASNVTMGLKYLAKGFIKKILIADFLGNYVNLAYSSNDQNGLVYIVGTILFAFQIYCDFSGYTDIGIGSAKLMGIDLHENFNSPYTSQSVKEFYSRWHMTLNTWFKDYIYIPLGGNKFGIIRTCFNLMIVFLVSGLWHGARWNFVIWGLINGLIIVGETLYHKYVHREKSSSIIIKGLKILLTFSVVSFTWIFFRSDNLDQAFNIIKVIFTSYQGGVETLFKVLDLNYFRAVLLVISPLLLVFINKIPQIKFEDESLIVGRGAYLSKLSLKYVLYMLIIVFIAIGWFYQLSQYGASGFIYFEF